MTGFDDLRAPDEAGARARAWGAIAAEPLPHARRPSRAPAGLAALVAALALTLALTPPGDAVATWVKRAVGVEAAPRPTPTGLERLPGGGRVLLVTPSLYVAGGGRGPKRLLGQVDEATWSPHGLFAAAIRNRTELIAVDMDGHRRWHVAGRDLHGARWSPDGFRVAYLSHDTLRVVAGDGTDDLLFARTWPASAPPAWRPGRRHVIAYLDRHRRLAAGDTDTAALLFRRSAPARVRQLLWTPGGRQLIVVGARQTKVLDGRTGRALRAYTAPPGWATEAAVLTRDGLAFARVRGPRAEIVDAAGRRLFAAPSVGTIAAAPNGRWLMVDWTGADAWVFLPLGTSRHPPRQVSHIARHFAQGTPVLAGWCCTPR